MAKDKSSVLLYRDIIHTVEKLDDVTAGLLFKHYLRYINDLNPETNNPIVEIAFESIKQNLKRDLKSYEKTCEKNRENAYIRWGKKDATASDRIRVDAKHADTDTDTDTDKDNDKDKDNGNYKCSLLSEISKEKFPDLNNEYIEIAKAFQKLFIKGRKKAGIKNSTIEKARGTWIDDVRLMVEKDKRTTEQFRKVYNFIQNDKFWRDNILSIDKLRKQFEQLVLKSKDEGKQTSSNQSKVINFSDGITD